MSINMPAEASPTFICPLCKAEISDNSAGFVCGACERQYPVVAGIVDFRICADPYIDISSDRAKAERIAAQAKTLSFADLVAFYYSITPEVPEDLARHYLNHHIAGTQRGEGILNRMQAYGLNDWFDAKERVGPNRRVGTASRVGTDNRVETDRRLLDLGCGTGGFLAAAKTRGATCFGADVALRWLVIARSRFRELGCDDITLVCACADHLPFRSDFFDNVVAENLLEHCSDTKRVLSECRRVRRSGGAFMARTINRYALGPEPHVGVWGVGYLPRSLMNPYVQLVKGIPYEHIHLDSLASLQQAIRDAEDDSLNTRVPLISEADYKHHPLWKQVLFRTYAAFQSAPIFGALLAQIGPYIDVISKSSKFDSTKALAGKDAICK